MSYPAREPAGSSRVVLAVTLAAVFLAVIGGSVGVVAGRNAVYGAGRHQADGGRQPDQDTGTTPPAQGPGGSAKPSHGTSASASRSTSPAIACPQPMAEQVTGKLTLVFYLDTDPAEAWICRTPDGKLWYEGHRKPNPAAHYPDDPLVHGTNALLLGGVESQQGGKLYMASTVDNQDRPVRYLVSAPSLVVEHGDGTVDNWKATQHWP